MIDWRAGKPYRPPGCAASGVSHPVHVNRTVEVLGRAAAVVYSTGSTGVDPAAAKCNDPGQVDRQAVRTACAAPGSQAQMLRVFESLPAMFREFLLAFELHRSRSQRNQEEAV